ncbi:hypothetical protein TIFTF001_008333 [Ficus carica]|uniref:Uncharacterized protein n=1 Tax=Ficus carica TaxID=3494 RepID=A0AA88DH10_FICCA|nr:hypothetical protein TIFTF001_008333 [Ficus carica]
MKSVTASRNFDPSGEVLVEILFTSTTCTAIPFPQPAPRFSVSPAPTTLSLFIDDVAIGGGNSVFADSSAGYAGFACSSFVQLLTMSAEFYAIQQTRNSGLFRSRHSAMKTTDSWGEIGFHLQFNHSVHHFIDTAVFCNGVVYWSLLNLQFGAVGIISFDMADDIFSSVPLPDNVGIQEEEIKIAVWMMDGCLNGATSVFSWTKKPTIRPLEHVGKPWTFCKNDELLMEGDEGVWFLCKVKSKLGGEGNTFE